TGCCGPAAAAPPCLGGEPSARADCGARWKPQCAAPVAWSSRRSRAPLFPLGVTAPLGVAPSTPGRPPAARVLCLRRIVATQAPGRGQSAKPRRPIAYTPQAYRETQLADRAHPASAAAAPREGFPAP